MAADCIRVRTLDHSYNVVVFMAAQPSKDGRLGGSPQNFYAGRHLFRFVSKLNKPWEKLSSQPHTRTPSPHQVCLSCPVNISITSRAAGGLIVTSVMLSNSWAIHTSVAPIVKLANYLDGGPGDGPSPHITLLSVFIYV